MPANTNNTPFTWTDAQWLNTQVTNCIERSTEAVATAAQALALINSLKRGTQLLSKTTGVNLNPSITLTYTSLVNTFAAGSTITDVNGSTAVIVSDNGSNSMLLTKIVLASGYNTLSGTITASSGGVTASATVNTFTWGDQSIALSGGSTFIITDIVLTNASAVPANASDTEWWSGTARTGINYANNINLGITIGIIGNINTNNNTGPDDSVLPLASANEYMSISNGGLGIPGQTSGNSPSTCGTVLYFTVGVPEGSSLTCDMYIYGYVLN
jgi:hypothetical protein